MRYFVRMIGTAVVVAVLLSSPQVALSQDKVQKNVVNPIRTFPAEVCQFRLLDLTWTWVEQQTPELLCMAKDRRGYVVNLGVKKLPQPTQLNKEFVESFEKGFYSSAGPRVKKHGGRYLTFKGLPAYQTETISTDGKNGVARVVLAHDRMYVLTVVGAKIAFDREPDFEKIMQGFEFTEPPAAREMPQTVVPLDFNERFFYGFFTPRSTRISGTTVVLLVIVGLLTWYFRKSAYGPGGM
jgi:hypothetical protein